MTKKTLFFLLQFTGFILLFAGATLFSYFLFARFAEVTPKSEQSVSVATQPLPLVILDAGHGGEDGGAVGINGVLEKELNLCIVKGLQTMLQVSDVPVLLTREEDTMLDTDHTKGNRKRSDLKNRVALTEKNPNSIFISIHMNKFSVEKYHGLQVYYSGNHAKSMDFAALVQEYTKVYLQPENERETKRANSNIFILDRIQTPAILVECGFLSNREETELLGSAEYQKKLVCVLYAAIMDFLANFPDSN